MTGRTRCRTQTSLSLRQHGTCHFICVSFLRSASAKTHHQKRIKHRCESIHLSHRVSPVFYSRAWNRTGRTPTMQLISINIGRVQPIQRAKSSGTTGIYKLPVGAAQITAEGLSDDAICDRENHGGVDQAVYVYGTPDYAWWSTELGRALAPGTFGENLTIADLESARLNVGDRLRIGDVVLEVTAPRIPCATLAARMGDPAFVKRFRHAERPGLYCRVIHEGVVQVGDPVRLERYVGETILAIEMFRDYYANDLDEAAIRRQLAAPIAVRARADIVERLEKRLA